MDARLGGESLPGAGVHHHIKQCWLITIIWFLVKFLSWFHIVWLYSTNSQLYVNTTDHFFHKIFSLVRFQDPYLRICTACLARRSVCLLVVPLSSLVFSPPLAISHSLDKIITDHSIKKYFYPQTPNLLIIKSKKLQN